MGKVPGPPSDSLGFRKTMTWGEYQTGHLEGTLMSTKERKPK